jgi:hypothetical protein
MLDIIEDWAVEFKGWNICRIDGSTDQMTRRERWIGSIRQAMRLTLQSSSCSRLEQEDWELTLSLLIPLSSTIWIGTLKWYVERFAMRRIEV